MDLKEAYELYGGLCWKIAHQFSKVFGGKSEDYIGTVIEKLAISLDNYSLTKGAAAFTTYLMSNTYEFIWRMFYRYESEAKDVALWMRHSIESGYRARAEEVKVQNAEFAYHEAQYFLYHVPEKDDDWAVEIITEFKNPYECFRFLTSGLRERDRQVLRYRFQEEMTLTEIGTAMGFTKQRAEQLYARAIDQIQTKLQQLERFQSEFKSEKDAS